MIHILHYSPTSCGVREDEGPVVRVEMREGRPHVSGLPSDASAELRAAVAAECEVVRRAALVAGALRAWEGK